MIDIIVEVLDKTDLNLSEEVAQALATDISFALEDNSHSLWADEARDFFEEILPILKEVKDSLKDGELKKIEISNLLFKIEELIIK